MFQYHDKDGAAHGRECVKRVQEFVSGHPVIRLNETCTAIVINKGSNKLDVSGPDASSVAEKFKLVDKRDSSMLEMTSQNHDNKVSNAFILTFLVQ